MAGSTWPGCHRPPGACLLMETRFTDINNAGYATAIGY